MPSRVYELKDVPQEVFDEAKRRAEREGWQLPQLIRQLLEDYATGRVSPSARAPLDPIVLRWWPLVKEVYHRLAAIPGWDGTGDRERGQYLRDFLTAGYEDLRPPSHVIVPADYDFTLLAKRLRLFEARGYK